MADIKLKNWSGTEQTYAGVQKIVVPTATGTAEFAISPNNIKVMRVTLESDKTYGNTNAFITSADSQIASHYTDNNLLVTIFPAFAVTKTRSLEYAVCGNDNRNFLVSGGYGFCRIFQHDLTSEVVTNVKAKEYTSTDSHVGVMPDGSIHIRQSTSSTYAWQYVLEAGDYFVIVSW